MAKKALIAMSGGVDSSVAAYLMVQNGYECTGATMKLYSNDDIAIPKGHTCCSLDDVEDARYIASLLDIPYYVMNFSDQFKEKVMDKFVNCYENGITPNPCIDCNRYLKFEYLYNRAKELGIDFVVTGHYAIIEYNEDTHRYLLKKSPNIAKDQSYVLYSLTQEQLAHTQFPLGAMKKEDVRHLAEENGFINAKKHDSQDICFVPDGDYISFIEKYTEKLYPKGNFIDKNGNILGEHKGIIRYTIGQRKGLGLSFTEPMYVMNINPYDNTVMLGTNNELFTTELIADDMNWISIEHPNEPIKVNAKVRYRHKEAPATVTPLADGKIKVVFDEPQRAITKGQAVVLYDGDIVVGGGTII
ncbi:MAG: tRNA 2-thiouridine(34) synthase MnmA [Lachnospiraceae bacterium]|nr:tRNA 2-thiouridine(34) synthase MnmA [Lachnospiraceae bacterium]